MRGHLIWQPILKRNVVQTVDIRVLTLENIKENM